MNECRYVCHACMYMCMSAYVPVHTYVLKLHVDQMCKRTQSLKSQADFGREAHRSRGSRSLGEASPAGLRETASSADSGLDGPFKREGYMSCGAWEAIVSSEDFRRRSGP